MNYEQLKNSILQEAIEGLLVPQDPNDEPAAVLLDRIADEKKRLIKEKKIKRDRNESRIYRTNDGHWMERFSDKNRPEVCIDNEIPFDIPESWEWSRLGYIFEHNTGKALNGGKGPGIPLTYITTSNLYWNRFELDNIKTMNFKDSEVEKCTIKKGDLLVCEGGDFGRAAIWNYDYDMRIQNHIHRLRSYVKVETKYFYYLFLLYKGIGLIAGKGIGIQGLSSGALHNILFPIPTLSEQHRIVAKLEEVLPKVEEYGKAQDRLDTLNSVLPEKLKASILQEAIEGRLVPQSPDDEPASKLLDRIAEEKAKLVKEKKIKVDKKASRIYRTDDGHWMEHFADKHRTDVCIDDEIPFNISEKWEWTRFGNVFDITMGQSPSGESLNKSKDGIEFHQGKILFTNEYLDVSNTYTNKPTKIAEENSLLLCVRAPVGIVNITKRNICIGRGLCSIKPLGNMPLLFFFYVIQTLKSDFEDRATGSTFKAISREIIYNELIPIPPIEEQKRIVEKIEAILPKLETLI